MKSRNSMKSPASLAILALTAAASAQPTNATFILTSSNIVTATRPSTTISVYAVWDQPDPPMGPNSFVLGAVGYDLVASDGDFTAANLVLGMQPPNNPGVPAGSRVTGAAIGQVHIPSLQIFGDSDNPILLAEYTWTTTDFRLRMVDLSTENTANFSVVPWPGGLSNNLVVSGEFTPGAGSITVEIPAAPTLALLGACALLAARRRRQPGEAS